MRKAKRVVRLNESQLRQIVRESVGKVLNEMGYYQNADRSYTSEDGSDTISKEEWDENIANYKKRQKEKLDTESELCSKLISTNRRIYKSSVTGAGIGVNKIFNDGNGSLIFANFIPEEKVILLNKCICRNTDIKNVKSVFPDWTIEMCEIGYPDWYFIHDLRSVRNNN